MSWIQDLASFAKKLLTLEQRVDRNSERIESIHKELIELREFSRNLAYAVSRNQERAEDRESNLALSLENELLKLERRLSASQLKPDQK